ncbi:MAG TPA: DUF58 domain-containing protein [Isosphaeraceae bacterium]|jgi:uncharacterized protein (DUF58 family)|nr:DUF58 domain-containing protein [Isosphaeraceae bacterium]
MVWPGRNLFLAFLAPAIASLALLVPRSAGLKAGVIALDAMVAVVAVADLALVLGAGRLRASRRCGLVASLGERQAVELTIENPGRARRILKVRDDVPEQFAAVPAEFVVSVPPRGLVVLDYELIPRRRGSYVLRRVYALATSRLGFWQRSLRIKAETPVRVYPDVRQIARYTLLARRDKLSALGVRSSRRLGTDNEFERLRDYMRGDEPRNMDWRATARRRKLTVRAHQVNQSQRVIFLIDCGRMMAGDVGGGLSPLDHAFNAMLMLAHVALIRGDQVGLLAYADRVRAYVPPAGGPRRINRLVHAVHDIFPELVESRHDRAFVELDRRCRKRSLVVVMTNVFDDVNAQQVVDHLCNLVGRHLPLAALLRDRDLFRLADEAPESGPGLFAGAAAAAMLNWRERVLAALRGRGALTLDVFPEDLTAPLVNRYLQIKARHLL